MARTTATKRGRTAGATVGKSKNKGTAIKLVHLRMTADLHGYLTNESMAQGRTLSGLIVFACEEYRRRVVGRSH